MKVRVLFFSVLKDITGTDELTWQCEPEATVADLLNQMYEKWPALKEWDGSVLLAVDQMYVKRGAPLHEGAEVAVMPPVQGG